MKNWKAWLSALIIFFALPIFSGAAGLMNQESDVAVYVGVALIMALFVGVVRSAWYLGRLAFEKLQTIG